MAYTILQGDNRDTLKTLEDCSVDAVVTDPPYGIDFLGKSWDANTGALETYQECLRVLKPGGYILAFSAARTYHHLAVTLEQAGFEIRDQIMWLYGSGFPKAHDIGKAIEKREGKRANAHTGGTTMGVTAGIKQDNSGSHCAKCKKRVPQGIAWKGCVDDQSDCPTQKAQQKADNEWAGWKTALKPAHEPICMARKPFKGSCVDNVLEHGVGALNIDATRIEWEPGEQEKEQLWRERYMAKNVGGPTFQETNIKEQKCGGLEADAPQGRFPSNVLGAVEGYQKYFYCPKVSRKERHIGFDTTDIPTTTGGMYDVDGTGVQYNAQKVQKSGNNHPTVKPVELMKYLIKLVTPENSVVLDPFSGSGSTGMAAVELGHTYIGCELDPAYVDIAEKRIEAWNTEEYDNTFKELFE